MTTEERFAHLERQVRWLGRVCALCLAAVAVVVLVGQGQDEKPQDLVVRSLTVVDESGTKCAQLDARGGGPSLLLGHSDGKLRASLGVLPDGSSSLSLIDKDGSYRVSLSLALGEPSLVLKDKNGKSRVDLRVMSDESPTLYLMDKDGTFRASLGLDSGGAPSLRLKNNRDKIIWKAPGE